MNPVYLSGNIVPQYSKVSFLGNGSQVFSRNLEALVKKETGKIWKPSQKDENFIREVYSYYPFKDKVNLADLSTEDGLAFLREVLFQIADTGLGFEKGIVKEFSQELTKIGDIFDILRIKIKPEVYMKEIHNHVNLLVKRLAKGELNQIPQITKSENHQRWTYWQQRGGVLKRDDHKKIYEFWDISMQELSNLHRNIEALNHMLRRASNDTSKGESAKLSTEIKKLAQEIVDSDTLEKMTKPPAKLNRPDIPNNPVEYHQQWRTLRTAPGSRDSHVLRERLGPT